VRTDVIAAAPADDFTRLPGDAFAQFAGQAVGDFAVFCLRGKQVGLEPRAENCFQAGAPKTCSKLKPASLPEIKSSSRR
jgi:hypothetical protein